MTRVQITVEAVVHPTESVEKVERAVRNVLGDVELQKASEGSLTTLKCHLDGVESLQHFKNLLRRMRIRDAAKEFITRRARGDQLLAFG
ncbi:MAG: RNA-binding domain-containing protein, partial [Candidatus Bathyarchaeia archaeon]